MKYSRIIISLVLPLVYCRASVFGQTGEIDRYVETEMRNLHIPGVSLAVVRDEQSIRRQYVRT